MRRFFSAILLASSLFGAAAYGQYRYGYTDRYSYDGSRRDRALFDRVRSDLDRAGRYQYASRGDLKRFDEARRELFDFESRFDRGRYDRHQLDEAISKVQHVVDRNSLDPRDRGALAEDLRLMRDFRSYRSH